MYYVPVLIGYQRIAYTLPSDGVMIPHNDVGYPVGYMELTVPCELR
jgi:hypothetical protein